MATIRAVRPFASPAPVRQLILSSRPAFYSTASSPAPPPQSTVSETEVSHFSDSASSWWDPHGPSRILHLMNPLRHTFIQRCRSRHPDSASSEKLRYLDVGCGGGIFAESAARHPQTKSVTAIDPTPQVIAVAQKHQRTDPRLMEPGRSTYLNTAIENIPLPPTPEQGVDILTCFEVIEHIRHPRPFLAQLLPHIKPGGWSVMSTISRTWTSWFTTKSVAEDIMGIVPRGTHDWNQYINVEEMKAWADKSPGWGSAQSMGVIYVPGVGWREVRNSESWGNYFFAIKKDA